MSGVPEHRWSRHWLARWLRPVNRVEAARVQATLRATDARLKQALKASGMGTFVYHVQEDRGEPDARMLELFGLPARSALNLATALQGIIHRDDRERYAAAVRRAVDPLGRGELREDIRVVHPTGAVIWLSISAQVTFEGEPRIAVRMAGVATDISARKLTEEALRLSEAQHEISARKKDDFLATLAHELRNPLAPIRTGLHLLQQLETASDGAPEVLEMIERQVGHLVRLVDDLLDISRITTGKLHLQKHPTTLAVLVSTVVESHRASIETGNMSLALDLPQPTPILNVDPTRFIQVLSNLLHNAIKFSNRGGRISISATCDAGRAPALTLSVVDDGAGISRSMLPRVFDMFAQDYASTTRATNAGLGIGLALARHLVDLHGGTIEAESEGQGMGSRFTLRVPLGASEVDEPAPVSVVSVRVKARVVIIDDNADAADTLALLVGTMGADFRVAYDGHEGLQRVAEFRPQVVFLDIGMPGMDGYETCQRIRRVMAADVFVVALTGWGQERDKAQAIRAGFDAHLTKPADPAVVLRLISEGAALVGERRVAGRGASAPVS